MYTPVAVWWPDIFIVSDLIFLFYATLAKKAEFDCKTYVPKEKALTDSEIDALKIYPEPPEDVDVTTRDVDADIYFQYIYLVHDQKKYILKM